MADTSQPRNRRPAKKRSAEQPPEPLPEDHPTEDEPAVERGERIATGKSIARGGKEAGHVSGATVQTGETHTSAQATEVATSPPTPSRSGRLARLVELIEDIRVALLTTATRDGALRSRPMVTLRVDPAGDLWFFTQASAAKAEEIRANPHVNVGYAAPDDGRYVSVSGTAALVRDRGKMAELWNPAFAVWFPRGLDDPDLTLLRIDVKQAEYWDAPTGAMAEIAGM